ncbi:unnamed protein product [Amaranthus hypochondriacus]
MEGKYAKVLDSDRRVFDVKRKKASRYATYLARNAIPKLSTLKSSAAKLGKRKKPDVCKTKCRSYTHASSKSLVRYYSNFMKSGLPKRLMFFHNGEWIDHELDVVALVKKGFEHKIATIEVKFKSYHLVIDFVHMVQFNFKSFLEQPIAWIDEGGCCFFPEIYTNCYERHRHFHSDILIDGPQDTQDIKLQIEIQVNEIGDSKLVEYCGESSPFVKRIKIGHNAETEDSCDKVSNLRMNEDVGENQHLLKTFDAEVENVKSDLDPDAVKEMFLKGMDSTTGPMIVEIHPYTGSLCQAQLELFLKQVEITKKYRGNANISYAWLALTKDAVAAIMTYGLGHFGYQQIKSIYGTGVHLAAANCADASANFCDVDENGVRHMVLCRVIMGNMEVVNPGSKQFHPTSESFDSGVDDLENPRHYIVWSMNINTHIYPEYVVSFKVSANYEGALKNGGNHKVVEVETVHHSPIARCKIEPAADIGNDHQSNVTSDGSKERCASLSSTAPSLPTSPWMPFPLLFEAISKQIPQSSLKLLLAHYDLLKERKICRDDFIKELRLIVGDALLKSTLKQLTCKVAPKDNSIVAAKHVGS